MKTLSILYLFVLSVASCLGQESNAYIRLQGTVFSADSIPVENAYLISYKTLRAYASNKNGQFDILVAVNDSLKINHLSFKPVVIIVSKYSSPLKLFLEFQENIIDEVSIKYRNADVEHLKSNMDVWLGELQNTYYYTCPVGPAVNSYAPQKTQSYEASVNLFEVIKWIKFKSKHRK